MALVSHSGSYKAKSSTSQKTKQSSDLVKNTEASNLTEDDIVSQSHVRDTFIERTALDVNRFEQDYRRILAFAEGAVVKVLYFSRNPQLSGVKTGPSQTAESLDDIHHQYTQIEDFEILLDGEISGSFDEESGETTYTGEAKIYPGFMPTYGDIFIYKINDQLCEFQLTRVERANIGTDAYHFVSFVLVGYITSERIDQLIRNSIHKVYFDRQRFLTGDAAFLEHEAYHLLNKISDYRKELIECYYRKFFDQTASSLFSPSGAYDPYVVTFMQRIVSLQEAPRPQQILVPFDDFENSFWYRLLSGNRHDFKWVSRRCKVERNYANVRTVGLTTLLNRDYLKLTDDEQDTWYVFGELFYEESPMMGGIGKLVIDTQHDKLDIKELLTELELYTDKPTLTQFYDIPLLLWMCSVALQN